MALTVVRNGRNITISEDGNGTVSSETNRYTFDDVVGHSGWPTTDITVDANRNYVNFSANQNYNLIFQGGGSDEILFIDITGWIFDFDLGQSGNGNGGSYQFNNNCNVQAGVVFNGPSGTVEDGTVLRPPVFRVNNFAIGASTNQQRFAINGTNTIITGEIVTQIPQAFPAGHAGQNRMRIQDFHEDSNFWFTFDGDDEASGVDLTGFLALNNSTTTSDSGFFGARIYSQFMRLQQDFSSVDALVFAGGTTQRVIFQQIQTGQDVIATVDNFAPIRREGEPALSFFHVGGLRDAIITFNNGIYDTSALEFGNQGTGSARSSRYTFNRRHNISTLTGAGDPEDDVVVLMYEDIINTGANVTIDSSFTESNALNSVAVLTQLSGADDFALAKLDGRTHNNPTRLVSGTENVWSSENRGVYYLKYQHINSNNQEVAGVTYVDGVLQDGITVDNLRIAARSGATTNVRYFSTYKYGQIPIFQQEVTADLNFDGSDIDINLEQRADPHVTIDDPANIPMGPTDLNEAYCQIHDYHINLGRSTTNRDDVDRDTVFTVDGSIWDFGSVNVLLVDESETLIGWQSLGTENAGIRIRVGDALGPGSSLTGIRTTGDITIRAGIDISCSLEANEIVALDSVTDVITLRGSTTANTIDLGNGATHIIAGEVTANNINDVPTVDEFVEVADRAGQVVISGTINSRTGGTTNANITFRGSDSEERWVVAGTLTSTTGITFERTGTEDVTVLGPTIASIQDDATFDFGTGVEPEPALQLQASTITYSTSGLADDVAWVIYALQNGVSTLVDSGVGSNDNDVVISSADYDILTSPATVFYKNRVSRVNVRRTLAPTRLVGETANRNVQLDGLIEQLGVSATANESFNVAITTDVPANNRISIAISGVEYGAAGSLDIQGVTARYADLFNSTDYLIAIRNLNAARSLVDITTEGTDTVDAVLFTEGGIDFVDSYITFNESNDGQQCIPGARFLNTDFGTTNLSNADIIVPTNTTMVGGVPQVISTPRFADRIITVPEDDLETDIVNQVRDIVNDSQQVIVGNIYGAS